MWKILLNVPGFQKGFTHRFCSDHLTDRFYGTCPGFRKVSHKRFCSDHHTDRFYWTYPGFRKVSHKGFVLTTLLFPSFLLALFLQTLPYTVHYLVTSSFIAHVAISDCWGSFPSSGGWRFVSLPLLFGRTLSLRLVISVTRPLTWAWEQWITESSWLLTRPTCLRLWLMNKCINVISAFN